MEAAKPEAQGPESGEQFFIEEARQQAAQCWCDEENRSTVMDVNLAESAARAFGRKCRAEYADVLEAPEGAYTATHGPKTLYIAGWPQPARRPWPFMVSTECRARGNHLVAGNDEPERVVSSDLGLPVQTVPTHNT